jgi:hypothetical protein
LAGNRQASPHKERVNARPTEWMGRVQGVRLMASRASPNPIMQKTFNEEPAC